MQFQKATKQQAKLRMAIQGPSGGGKTRTGLEIARHLSERIAVIDTEHGSASKYSNIVNFDVLEIKQDYHPSKVTEALQVAADHGYGVVLFDSLTHFWNGPGGFLELVDAEVTKQRMRGHKADSFTAWKVVDPIYRRMVQSLLMAPMHVIVTLRAKTEYEKTESNGKGSVRKVGLAPEMRDNFQYEMDIEGMLDMEHNLAIGKTRCEELDGRVFHKPGKELAGILRAWLSDGAPAPAVAMPLQPEPQPLTPADEWDAAAAKAREIMASCKTLENVTAAKSAIAKLAPKASPHRAAIVAELTSLHASMKVAA
jgi:hypothetical protein